MNAPPESQLRLLELQALDSALDRLAHRRRTLPEHEQLRQVDARLDELGDEVLRAETDDRDLAREQTRLEGDVDVVRTRAARDRQRLDSGQVSSPRELENLQSELVSLARRQDDLEEQVLEVMERREQVQGRLATLVDERAGRGEEQRTLTDRRAAALDDIDRETADRERERAAAAADLPADLLAAYERIRADKGGVGAAALYRGRCQGCHLDLAGSDLAALRAAPPDAVVRCEECGRILVRTPESGL